MRKLEYIYTVDLKFSGPVYNHLFQLRCFALENKYQKLIENKLTLDPNVSFAISKDGFNNNVISGRIDELHDSFHFEVKGIVEVEYQNLHQEECHPMYKFQTELTRYDDIMSSLIPKSTNFFEQMMELSRNIYFEIYYTPNSTSISTTAIEAFKNKKGVCQDFSHIMLAIVRHLGYPARYVAGMMSGEGETHAWVEVYHNDVWHGFDPTNNRPVNNQYIVIAKGRDYRDCAIDKGTFEVKDFVEQTINAHVSVKNI